MIQPGGLPQAAAARWAASGCYSLVGCLRLLQPGGMPQAARHHARQARRFTIAHVYRRRLVSKHRDPDQQQQPSPAHPLVYSLQQISNPRSLTESESTPAPACLPAREHACSQPACPPAYALGAVASPQPGFPRPTALLSLPQTCAPDPAFGPVAVPLHPKT